MIYPSYNWAIENGRLSQYVRIRQDAFTKTFNRSVLAHIPHSSPLLAPPLVIACERQHSTFFTTLHGMSFRTPSFIFILNFCSRLRFQTLHIMACERQHSTFFTTLPGMSSRTPSCIFILNFCSCLRFQTQHIMACERQHSTFFLKRKSNSQWDEQLNTEPSHTQLYLTALV